MNPGNRHHSNLFVSLARDRARDFARLAGLHINSKGPDEESHPTVANLNCETLATRGVHLPQRYRTKLHKYYSIMKAVDYYRTRANGTLNLSYLGEKRRLANQGDQARVDTHEAHR